MSCQLIVDTPPMESVGGYTVLDLQSGGTKSVTVDPFTQASAPTSLSRDGQLFAYVTYDASVYTFHVMNTATGVVRDIYALHANAATLAVQDAEISSDGKFVYFATDATSGQSQLQQIDLQSGATEVLITTGGFTVATISDNGRYTVVSKSDGVFRYDLQTQAGESAHFVNLL